MLGTPERRLLVVRVVRCLSIISCILFFAGVVLQLKSDLQLQHTDSGDSSDDDYSSNEDDLGDDQQGDTVSKRYLITLIASRTFLLFIILLVILGHISLSDNIRSRLAKMSFPLQGASWAQADTSISDSSQRSETLDNDLQGDITRLVGSAMFTLFASAQELSRSISQYLLVTAMMLASVAVLSLVTAILIYNPACSGANKLQDKIENCVRPSDTVFRERPQCPSFLRQLSPFPSAKRHGVKNANTTPVVGLSTDFNIPPAPRTPPPAMRPSHRGFPSPEVALQPATKGVTPMSPPLTQPRNGRHPLATEEALQLDLGQPLPATLANARPEDNIAAPTATFVTPEPGESDKDVLIRMWSAQIAEHKRTVNEADKDTRAGSLTMQQVVAGAAAHHPAHQGVAASAVPQTGGRMQITAPYLSLREARARFALRKAAAAATQQVPSALKTSDEDKKESPATVSQAMHKKLVLRDSRSSKSSQDARSESTEVTSRRAGVEQCGDVPGHRLGVEMHTAPKIVSMQASVGKHQSVAWVNDPAIDQRGDEQTDRLAPGLSVERQRGATSGTPSIVISVSSTEYDATRRRPPSLQLHACTRPNSKTSEPEALSPRYPPSDTTRWSRTSAGYTVRSAVTGAGTLASGVKDRKHRLGESNASDRSLRERDSRYLSAVLAAIRGPSSSSGWRPPSPAPSLPRTIPLPPPEPAESPRNKIFPPISPLRSPGMMTELKRAQEAALVKAKERNKLRSLWLAKAPHYPQNMNA